MGVKLKAIFWMAAWYCCGARPDGHPKRSRHPQPFDGQDPGGPAEPLLGDRWREGVREDRRRLLVSERRRVDSGHQRPQVRRVAQVNGLVGLLNGPARAPYAGGLGFFNGNGVLNNMSILFWMPLPYSAPLFEYTSAYYFSLNCIHFGLNACMTAVNA